MLNRSRSPKTAASAARLEIASGDDDVDGHLPHDGVGPLVGAVVDPLQLAFRQPGGVAGRHEAAEFIRPPVVIAPRALSLPSSITPTGLPFRAVIVSIFRT